MTIDVERDQGLDVELLLSDTIFVRVLMESHGNQLDDDFFSACDERYDEEAKDETLENVEIGV